ncbi:LysR family transcriptional regulator [Oceaniglobus indicus]|uniref:LysR family transcriptional regulator n=1 Tax=Oceaniglobus indicus TaxID=2047749 RepID=UPI000C1A2A82|nr:LysR family transcriptional regulator [Oceaniglobus indicus]
MDTRFIRTLLAVVETGSFAGAARRENLTPAAVAQRIRSLEARLGHRLVTRTGQTVAPTRQCTLILPRLNEIAKQVGQLAGDLDPTGLAGPVRLGAISTALSDRVPGVLARFAEQAPAASLTFVPGTSGDLYARLLEDRIDAAFVVRPPFAVPKSMACVPVETQAFVMIAPAGDDRSLAAIVSAERALVYDPDSWGGRIAMPWIRAHVPPGRILCELDALEAIAIAVGRGVGYGIVPDWPGLAGLASLRRIPLAPPVPTRDLVLLHRRLSPACVGLLQC